MIVNEKLQYNKEFNDIIENLSIISNDYNRKIKLYNIVSKIIGCIVISILYVIMYFGLRELLYHIAKPTTQSDIDNAKFGFIIVYGGVVIVITSIFEVITESLNGEFKRKITDKYFNKTVYSDIVYSIINFIENNTFNLKSYSDFISEIYNTIDFRKFYIFKDFEWELFKYALNIDRYNSYLLLERAYRKLLSHTKYNSTNYDIYKSAYIIQTQPFIESIDLEILGGVKTYLEKEKFIGRYDNIYSKEIDQMEYNLKQSYIIWKERRDDSLRINYEKFISQYRIEDNN